MKCIPLLVALGALASCALVIGTNTLHTDRKVEAGDMTVGPIKPQPPASSPKEKPDGQARSK